MSLRSWVHRTTCVSNMATCGHDQLLRITQPPTAAMPSNLNYKFPHEQQNVTASPMGSSLGTSISSTNGSHVTIAHNETRDVSLLSLQRREALGRQFRIVFADINAVDRNNFTPLHYAVLVDSRRTSGSSYTPTSSPSQHRPRTFDSFLRHLHNFPSRPIYSLSNCY